MVSRRFATCCPLNEAKLPDLPTFSLQQLEEEVTLGCYQLKQAESYCAEHADKKHGMYSFKVHQVNIIWRNKKKKK